PYSDLLPFPTRRSSDLTLVAQILKISASYSPPPPEGFVSPMTWGIEENVIERFAAAGVPEEKISFARDTYTFNYPGTPSDLLARSEEHTSELQSPDHLV